MSADKKQVEAVEKMSELFNEMKVTMVRDRAKTKKLVEALMSIADLPGQSKHGDIAREAVEEWLK